MKLRKVLQAVALALSADTIATVNAVPHPDYRAPQQQPFIPPPSSAPPSFSNLQLQHAIHLSTSDRCRPPLHRRITPHERLAHASITGLTSASSSHDTPSIRTVPSTIHRPSSSKAFQAARRGSYYRSKAYKTSTLPSVEEMNDIVLGETLEWDEVPVEIPDVKDVKTLATLAKMASDAYVLPDDESWYDLKGKWNVSDSFGWDEDGLRGHVFADPTNSTIVVAIKGTSAAIVGGNSPTGQNDKKNDNLLFSCCCSRVTWSWSTVCDCYSGPYTCRQDCLEDAVVTKSAYYPIATDLYNNITSLYPRAQIWLTGHSLGGALASLLSLTYGVPSVSFESPGDLLPAQRLHLPMPPGVGWEERKGTVHVYHTADPIAMGTCVGIASTCSIAGFALESRCHTGLSIVYDTVNVLNWSVDIRTHRIAEVISRVLIDNWDLPDEQHRVRKEGEVEKEGWFPPVPGGGKKKKDDGEGEEGGGGGGGPGKDLPISRGVPKAEAEVDCVDCFSWTFE